MAFQGRLSLASPRETAGTRGSRPGGPVPSGAVRRLPVDPRQRPSVVREVGRVHDLDASVLLAVERSEEHTSELQSHSDLVCRLLLEKKKQITARWSGVPLAPTFASKRPDQITEKTRGST